MKHKDGMTFYDVFPRVCLSSIWEHGPDALAKPERVMLAERVMKKYMFLLVATVWVGTWSYAQAEVLNRIVATVDDEPITLHEVRSFGKAPGQRALFMPQGGAGGMSDRDILEVLIMNKLVGKEVETQGIKAKDDDIDNYIERIKTEGNLNDEQFKTALTGQGMTLEGYRKQVADEIERALLVNREIGSRVNVTPQDVERYFKEHSSDYAQAEQVRVRHIFLPLARSEEKELMAQIEDIRKRAATGEEFGKLADQYSQGPGAGQGGDLGYFKKGQMTKEIEDVAFSLKPGEISQPFRAANGLNLIKVEEHTVPGQQTIDPETTEQIKRKLYNDALKQRYDRWFQEDLRFRHNIENFLIASASSMSNKTLKKASTSNSGQAVAQTQESEQKGFFRKLWPF
jgi:peptidyl-prolyl cis-trans isomerase SurA